VLADQERLFQKYHRAGDARRIEGSGLGLYIVSHIAAAHKGKATVSSQPGRGSTFTLELPMRPEAA